MANLKLARRTVLTAGPLAFLLGPVIRKATAETDDSARQFITLFTPNGLNYSDAGPNGSETEFSLGDYYAPLEPHRAEILALSRMHVGGIPYGLNPFYIRIWKREGRQWRIASDVSLPGPPCHED